MEIVLASVGVWCGYVLTRWLVDERDMVVKFFSPISKFSVVSVFIGGVCVAVFPFASEVRATVLFVFLLVMGSALASQRWQGVFLCWLSSLAGILLGYFIVG